jgi:hypothetical protein
MKYLKNYNNVEMINESGEGDGWFELAIMRSEYNRDGELKEFFLELVDLGGKIIGIKNSTHTLVDENFEVRDRINYIDKPLYKGYTLRLRFDDLSSSIRDVNDKQMSSTIEFFNEFSDSLIKIKDFGYKFKILNFSLESSVFQGDGEHGIRFDIAMYHTEDIIPWEHIFAPYEK